MEWLIIIVILFVVSEYLYRSSSFSSNKIAQNNLEYLKQLETDYDKQFQALLDRDRGTSLVTDRTEIFEVTPRNNNQFMSAKDKKTYLQSDKWRTIRQQVFIRDKYRCQICGTNKSLNCHHISYINLGSESLEDLTTLCEKCHTNLHNELGYDRNTLFYIK